MVLSCSFAACIFFADFTLIMRRASFVQTKEAKSCSRSALKIPGRHFDAIFTRQLFFPKPCEKCRPLLCAAVLQHCRLFIAMDVFNSVDILFLTMAIVSRLRLICRVAPGYEPLSSCKALGVLRYYSAILHSFCSFAFAVAVA